MTQREEWDRIGKRLAEPFESASIGWKAQVVKGNRCLPVAYIDARDVCDRLDEVVGAENWKTEYRQIPDGVECTLSLRVGSEWVPKADVGGYSDQPDKGDRVKAAYSDSLKRAAVQWGIGRYLYRLESPWCDYDPVKKQVINPPALPPWALPKMIGPDQVAELKTLMKQADSDSLRESLLERYGLETLLRLPAKHYLSVEREVREYIARQAKAAAEHNGKQPAHAEAK